MPFPSPPTAQQGPSFPGRVSDLPSLIPPRPCTPTADSSRYPTHFALRRFASCCFCRSQLSFCISYSTLQIVGSQKAPFFKSELCFPEGKLPAGWDRDGTICSVWCSADSPLTLSRTAGVKQGPLHENQMHLNSSVAQPRPAKCGYFHAPNLRHVTTGITKVLLLCDSVTQSSCFLSMVIIKRTMQKPCQAALSASQHPRGLGRTTAGQKWASLLWVPGSCAHSPICSLHPNASWASLP